MRNLVIYIYAALFLLTGGCASIPQETVVLSKTIGTDIQELRISQTNLIRLYYGNISSDIDGLIDNVYRPFVINRVLSQELADYKLGKNSIYGNLTEAAKADADLESINLAVNEMQNILDAANLIIERKRSELLDPLENQRDSLLFLTERKYDNLISANSSLTGYLVSLTEIKKAQREAIGQLNLQDADLFITNNLVRSSELINKAIKASAKIDSKSDEALDKFNEITDNIKKAINEK